jgi:hypothetical protein
MFGKRTYSDMARILWQGAREGRRAARLGHRAMAFAMADPLRGFDGTEKLDRLAHGAAVDIERILAGQVPEDKVGNVVEMPRRREAPPEITVSKAELK